MVKRLSLGVLMILAVSSLAQAGGFDFNLTAGLDYAGSFSGNGFDTDSSTGYSLGLEAAFDLPIVELGVGLEYGFPRGNDLNNADVDYTFLYGIGRLGIIGPLYLAARVGYADVSASDLIAGDMEGGETWSAGVGAGFLGRFKVEAFWNNFSANIDSLDSDVDYETYSLRLVVTF